MAARITAESLHGQELPGHIRAAQPPHDEKGLWNDHPEERLDTKTREVWIELDDPPSLVIGLRVDVMIDPRAEKPKTKHETTKYTKNDTNTSRIRGER